MSKLQIRKILNNNDGVIFADEIRKRGIPTMYLTRMVANGELIHYAPGIYTSQDYFPDDLHLNQKRFSKIIYSHDTALYLLGLVDRNPLVQTVTIPYNFPSKKLDGIDLNIYYTKTEFLSLGVITHKNQFGNLLKIYDAERSLCDLLRHKTKIDLQILTTAFQTYVTGDVQKLNLPKLFEYAKILGVSKKIKERISILL